jgi:outer membrane protein
MGNGVKWWMAAVLATAVAFTGAAHAEGLKVAVIDVNRILNESEAGKVAKKKMEDRYEELKKKIDEKQEEARKIKDEIDKQKILLGKRSSRRKRTR